jgi:hypothetical protein
MDFSDKIALVLDQGCYTHVAQRLARDFGMVYYWSSWPFNYPNKQDKSIGSGLEDEGVERVDHYQDILKSVSKEKLLIVIADGNTGPFVEDLRGQGYRIWGTGRGERLEYSRKFAKRLMKELKMPVNDYDIVMGVEKARLYLKDAKNEGKFVKHDVRGQFETFQNEKWKLSEPIFENIANDLGATGHEFEFMFESPIPDAVEYGYDGFCIDGKFPESSISGIEIKDSGYLGHVKPMKDISPLITDALYKLQPFLSKTKYRQCISTESRINKKKESFVIDFTNRFPSPPGEIYEELWENFSDIIWFGAEGILVEPKFSGKYAAQAIIQSTWAAGDGVQPIFVPKEIRNQVKLKNLYKANDTYYFLPVGGGYTEIGGVVAIGDSVDECFEKLKKYSDMVEGYKLNINVGSIDKAQSEIKKGESLGIKF